MINIFKNLMLLTVLTFSTPQFAVSSINSTSKYYKTLGKENLVIAHFYSKQNKNLYNHDKDAFSNAEDLHPFLEFLKINIDKEKLHEITSDINNTPTFIVFYRGEEVARTYFKEGTVTVSELDEFIRNNLQIYIDEAIKEKKERKRREHEAWIRQRDLFYTYPYYRYPYYHRYPYRRYRHGGHIGVGFGWHH